MKWTIVESGKYKGKSLPQIIFKDADWFFWACNEKVFDGMLAHEAQVLINRAQSIRIPQRNGQKMLVEYVLHYDTKSRSQKFGTMRLIADGPGLEHLNVSPSIDFYVPRSYAIYDKTGYKNFIAALKGILFDNSSRRMNRQACEAFFNDDNNFDL